MTGKRPLKILLFDMDGVLLKPRGYHKALVETVRLIGEVLGYEDVTLSPVNIAHFEAVGITSEWDSSAICTILMLLPLWEHFPDLAPPTSLRADHAPCHKFPPPPWDAFLTALSSTSARDTDHPMLGVEALLGAGHPHRETIAHILRNTHQVHASLSHRLFQELVLGSRVFAQTYSLDPWLETKGYLQEYDRPSLSDSQRERLLVWQEGRGHHASIFTNRPSLPPGGEFGTPEAEIGAQCVGLDSLPLVGYGDVSWLSAQLDVDVRYLRKPSPVHVLGALLRSLGYQSEDALRYAAALALSGKTSPLWKAFEDAQLTVFEETTAGLRSALAAQKVLASMGISVTLAMKGITKSKTKRASLESMGARVYPDLSAAGAEIMQWPVQNTIKMR